MRRLIKFLHTLGSVAVMGAMAALLVMAVHTPAPAALPGYSLMRGAMGAVATWIFLPGLALVLVSGLFAIAATRAYLNAGWAWAKLATGVLMFEGGLVYVQGPMAREADLSARALARGAGAAGLGLDLAAERGTLWVLLAVSAANVALAIWRPRLLRLPKAAPP